jgi:antitoxin MazE
MMGDMGLIGTLTLKRYTLLYVYLLRSQQMIVSKWGNSLAIRLPSRVVDYLKLKEGDDIEVLVADKKHFQIQKKPSLQERIEGLRKFRGRMSADFHFDRSELNER